MSFLLSKRTSPETRENPSNSVGGTFKVEKEEHLLQQLVFIKCVLSLPCSRLQTEPLRPEMSSVFCFPTSLHIGRREQPSQLKLRTSVSPRRTGLHPENKLRKLGAMLSDEDKGNDGLSAKDISSLDNTCISTEALRDIKLACTTGCAVSQWK
jgi:hypothetical protein